MPRVSYVEMKTDKKGIPVKIVEIRIEEGENPETYTEEQEKLLGDCKIPWTLFVDGYDEEGQRIYDPFEGKSCHQCRYVQNTLKWFVCLAGLLHLFYHINIKKENHPCY